MSAEQKKLPPVDLTLEFSCEKVTAMGGESQLSFSKE
jgi:hypothetical protein